MKKSLLTLMLGLSFVFFGSFVAKAETSTDNLPNSVKISKSEFNKKIVALKLICKNEVGAMCDAAVASADRAATNAWNICMANIDACQEAQDLAINILNNAAELCRLEQILEYGVSSIEKPKSIPPKNILVKRYGNA